MASNELGGCRTANAALVQISRLLFGLVVAVVTSFEPLRAEELGSASHQEILYLNAGSDASVADELFGIMLRTADPRPSWRGGDTLTVDQVAFGGRFGAGSVSGFVGLGSPFVPVDQNAWADLPVSLGVDFAPTDRVLLTGEIRFPVSHAGDRAGNASQFRSLSLSASFRF